MCDLIVGRDQSHDIYESAEYEDPSVYTACRTHAQYFGYAPNFR